MNSHLPRLARLLLPLERVVVTGAGGKLCNLNEAAPSEVLHPVTTTASQPVHCNRLAGSRPSAARTQTQWHIGLMRFTQHLGNIRRTRIYSHLCLTEKALHEAVSEQHAGGCRGAPLSIWRFNSFWRFQLCCSAVVKLDLNLYTVTGAGDGT